MTSPARQGPDLPEGAGNELAVCRYCGGPDEEDGVPTNSGTCGACFYGMRLCPHEWRAELAAAGRLVTRGAGCQRIPGVGIVCHNPYEPAGER